MMQCCVLTVITLISIGIRNAKSVLILNLNVILQSSSTLLSCLYHESLAVAYLCLVLVLQSLSVAFRLSVLLRMCNLFLNQMFLSFPDTSIIIKSFLKSNIMQKLSFLFDLVNSLSRVSKISKNLDMPDLSSLVEHVKMVAIDHLKSNVDSLVDGMPESSSDGEPEV